MTSLKHSSVVRKLSKSVNSELSRVAKLPSPWIVADMDSTLIKKERGEYPDLNASPVKQHLIHWLTSGGHLLVVTSDEGHSPFKQLIGQIPSQLRSSVILATGEGAVLYKHSKKYNTFIEDLDYQNNYHPGLPSPLIAVDVACELKRDFMFAAYDNRALLEQVAPESRKLSYETLFKSMNGINELKELLTNEYLCSLGVLPNFRGSCIWKNDNAIPKGWDGKRNVNKKTTAVNCGINGETKIIEEQSEELPEPPKPIRRCTTLWVLGIGQHLSSSTFITEEYRQQLQSVGITAESAPNSIMFKNSICNKALPIGYLYSKTLQNNSVAFGDNPKGNDAPMTKYVDQGMPFVSVSSYLHETPCNCHHVGGLEHGTALCLEYMNAIRDQHMNEEEEDPLNNPKL
jgi:hypothetical protein